MKCKILILSLFLTTIAFSQNLNKLIENNGFRKIKLNSNIKEYVDEKGYFDFIKKDSVNLKYFKGFTEYNYRYARNDYNKIGNTEILRIFVKTHNDIIYKIYIITEPNLEVYELLELAYGKPNSSKYLNSIGQKSWQTENFRCSLNCISGANFFQLEYYNYEIGKKALDLEMEKEKAKRKKAIKEF